MAKLKAAPPYRRAEMLAQIERDYGRGFARTLRDTISEEQRVAQKAARIMAR